MNSCFSGSSEDEIIAVSVLWENSDSYDDDCIYSEYTWLTKCVCVFWLYYDVMSSAFGLYISYLATRNPKTETIHCRLHACFINLKFTTMHRKKCVRTRGGGLQTTVLISVMLWWFTHWFSTNKNIQIYLSQTLGQLNAELCWHWDTRALMWSTTNKNSFCFTF